MKSNLQTILIVDDEQPIRELISYNLEKESFQCLSAENGTSALLLARSEKPNLIILDLMLPDMSGLDICRILKNDKETMNIPIIMATAKTEDTDIIKGLELGADDYVTKPFSPKVLIARVKSVLRRTTTENVIESTSIVRLHNLSINPEKFEVIVDGQQMSFSATEFSLLLFLVQNPGRVFTRQNIINAIKGSSYPVTERSIDVQILSIRKKLGAECDIIETVRGVGYRVIEE